jgi:hypothetical protein
MGAARKATPTGMEPKETLTAILLADSFTQVGAVLCAAKWEHGALECGDGVQGC